MDDEATIVLFRKWRDTSYIGDGIIALFPCEPFDDAGVLCTSFEHVGQHGAAGTAHVIANSRPASPAEYAALKQELEGPPYGYKLKVRKRMPRHAAKMRRARL